MAQCNGSHVSAGDEKVSEASLKDTKPSIPNVGILDKDCFKQPEEIIDEYMSSVTVHGVNKVYQANHIALKCFWGIVFLTFFGTFISQVVMLVNRTYKYEVQIEYRSVENHPMVFLGVNICNKVPYGIEAGLDILRASYRFGYMDDFGTLESRNYNENLIRLLKVIETKQNNIFSTIQ